MSIINCVARAEDKNTEEITTAPQVVYPLPGALDQVITFNSNSPEIIKEEGILLSTFPPDDKMMTEAHLNFPLEGRFNLFAHHINNTVDLPQPKTLYISAIVQNAGTKKAKLKILKGRSYLSQPDAPFINLDNVLENPEGSIYAGPGDRVMTEFLLEKKDLNIPNCPSKLSLKKQETKLLFNLPITVKSPNLRVNGRSTLIQLFSKQPIYMATLAMFAPLDENGRERAPTLSEWQKLLSNGKLAGPREEAATPPGISSGKFKYGRVAGLQRGSKWTATFTDNATRTPKFRIPSSGHAVSFPISTVDHGSFGTEQIQSAPLLYRYADTAYQSHGNYGCEYDLKIPLYNDSKEEQTVIIKLQTPLKSDKKEDSLAFFNPPAKNIFFRGTIELCYRDDNGHVGKHYIHLVERRGQSGQPLLKLRLRKQEKRNVEFRLFYPPDATPPQVLTIETE